MKTSAARVLPPRENWTDERLVQACLDGNEDAWTIIVSKYKRLIYSIPAKHGLAPEDCADVFQSVCLELLKELPRLREPRALAGWLIKVTVHKCFHWSRKESRYVSAEDDAVPPWESTEPRPDLDLDALLDEVERDQTLRVAIADLSKRCRKLVTMLFFEFPPIPYNAVAKQLGLARGSIGFIRRRCLDRLRRSLEDKGFSRLG